MGEPVKLDINIDSKAYRKTLSVFASGIGAVAGLILKPAHAKADAKVLLIQQQAQKDALSIADGSKTLNDKGQLVPANQLNDVFSLDNEISARFEFQEKKRQNNLKSLAHKTLEKIDDVVSDKPVDEDWISKYFSYAQDVTSDDMQEIWAKVLAREISNPDSVAVRTLEVLKNLNKKDADLIERFSTYIMDGRFFITHPYEDNKFPLSYDEMLHLKEIGIIHDIPQQTESTVVTHFCGENEEFLSINIECQGCEISLENKNLKRFSFRSVVLTQSGMEIIKSLPAKSANLEHIEKVKGFFFKNGFLEVA